MHSKVIAEAHERTYVLIFDTGDDVLPLLTDFARQQNLTASHFTAIGAFQRLTLGYFDWQAKEYLKIPIDEQVEVLSLVGDVSVDKGEPKVHAHVVVGKSDATAHGGHLLSGHVRPTLEIVMTETPAYLRRTYDRESGLALIDLTR